MEHSKIAISRTVHFSGKSAPKPTEFQVVSDRGYQGLQNSQPCVDGGGTRLLLLHGLFSDLLLLLALLGVLFQHFLSFESGYASVAAPPPLAAPPSWPLRLLLLLGGGAIHGVHYE